MSISRQAFLQTSLAGGAALTAFGFDVAPLSAQAKTLKISRTSETRSTCPYCSVSCGVNIHDASGIPMWFPVTFGRITVAISYVLHDVAALVMLVGFIVHVYEGTAAQPGTFTSMTRGTVDRRWAWTHHPARYRRVTGRDPRADHDQARALRPLDAPRDEARR